jgi:probable phosphoglycerate mutase
MISLLVLRHGPTDWNRKGIIQGHTDRPLSNEARKELARRRVPAGWADATCLSSPLQRANETARLLGLEPRPEPRLIEMDWGDWEGKTLAELRAAHGGSMVANEARGLDFRPAGGESPRDVQARLRPLLAELGGPTIFVTHKGVLRSLYALATGWDMAAKPPHKLLDGRAHAFKVAGDGALRVAGLNIPLEAKP